VSAISLRYRLEDLGVAAVEASIMGRPHERARSLGRRIGAVGWSLARGPRRLALDNLALVFPELEAAERERIARECFRHFGSAFAEFLSSLRFDADEVDRRFDVEGWEHVESALSRDRGMLIFGGHVGHHEVAPLLLGRRLGGAYLLARLPTNPHVAERVRRRWQRFGNTVVHRVGGSHRIWRVLKDRGVAAINLDQRMKAGTGGILAPFLGRPALSTPVPAYLSLRSGAPAVPVSCVAVEGGRYLVRFLPPILPAGEGDEAVAALTERYLEAIGDEVRARPELWFWLHRRWAMD
jgi:KDO2-lipid IV(A) lauroyltransferase